MKVFTYVIITVVAAAIVTAFFVVGSPQTERLRRFDSQRVSDLTQIQNEILNYWQSKQVLPPTLASLFDLFTGNQIPKDPQTGTDYVYVIKAADSFSLCTTFNLASQTNNQTVPVALPTGQYNWDHSAGYFCFDRTIDKQLYPPYSNVKPAPVR